MDSINTVINMVFFRMHAQWLYVYLRYRIYNEIAVHYFTSAWCYFSSFMRPFDVCFCHPFGFLNSNQFFSFFEIWIKNSNLFAWAHVFRKSWKKQKEKKKFIIHVIPYWLREEKKYETPLIEYSLNMARIVFFFFLVFKIS